MFYLFPYGRVKAGSTIAIYGGGEIGLSYLEQLKATGYCRVACLTDQQITQLRFEASVPFIPSSEIAQYEFDAVVIASHKYCDDIYATLRSIGIDQKSIIAFDPKEIIRTETHLKTPSSFNWNNYYQNAESSAKSQFDTYIKPVLTRYASDISLDRVLDFACGKGRMAELFADISNSVICADISDESIEYCKRRFSNKPTVTFLVSEANRIPVESNSVSFLYSWDAMVHFRYKDLDILLGEIFRVMASGAMAFIHHSNLAALSALQSSEDWTRNPGFRSNVDLTDIKRLAQRHGFHIIEQSKLDWSIAKLDGITVLKKS